MPDHDQSENGKLWVRYGKKAPFRPCLRLNSTGYCPAGQLVGVMFHPNAQCGLETIYTYPNVKDALAHYFSELKRCNHVPCDPPTTIVNPRSATEKRCPECGVGIIGRHMRIHQGSEVCKRRKADNEKRGRV